MSYAADNPGHADARCDNAHTDSSGHTNARLDDTDADNPGYADARRDNAHTDNSGRADACHGDTDADNPGHADARCDNTDTDSSGHTNAPLDDTDAGGPGRADAFNELAGHCNGTTRTASRFGRDSQQADVETGVERNAKTRFAAWREANAHSPAASGPAGAGEARGAAGTRTTGAASASLHSRQRKEDLPMTVVRLLTADHNPATNRSGKEPD